MTDDRQNTSRPPGGPLDGDDSVDDTGELTAELMPDQVVASTGRTRIWSFHPGQLVAERYRIVRTIAQGGMGEVYEADDLELGGRVALKTIRAEAAAQEVLLGRFRREIQIARRVTHPNVCRLFDVSYHTIEIVGSSQLTNRLMCVSMELLDGETLSQKISRDGAMEREEALSIVRQLADGLAAAHTAGVIHRDFKSGNVLLVKTQGSETGDAKLRAVITDFGLARHAAPGELDTSLTDSGVVVGTPAYMAPEQFEGKEASSASDIYSFGVVLYEMVTGRKPFDGATPISQAIQRLKAPPSSPAKFCLGLDPVWETAILRCLESDPAARFTSPLDVVAALEGRTVAPALGRSRNKTLRRQRFDRLLTAAAIVAATCAIGFGLYKVATKRAPLSVSSTAEATPVIEVRPGAVVIGFKDLSGKPENRWMSTAFSEMIRTELAAGEKLRLVSGEDTARVRHELELEGRDSYSKETLATIRESLGADYVVAGSYVALGSGQGGRLRLDLRVQAARPGETIKAISESGSEVELLAMVASAGTKLRSAFGQGALNTERAAGLAASRPQSPEVIRLYAEGLALLRDFDALGAKGKLEKAVAIEPEFALAHAALAEAWSTLGYDARAVAQAQRAFDLSKSLGREDSLAIEGRLRAMQKDWKKAAEVYTVLHGFVPDDLDYGIRLTEAHATAGDHAAARDAIKDLRALALPLSADPRIDIADAQVAKARGDVAAVDRLSQAAIDKGRKRGAILLVARAQLLRGWALRSIGKYDASISTLDEAKAIYAKYGDVGGVALADMQAGNSAFYVGNFEEARVRFDSAKATCSRIGWKSCEASVLNSLGGMAWIEGRYGDAEKQLRDGLALSRETSDKLAELMARHNIAEIEIYLGRTREALTHANEVLAEIETGTGAYLGAPTRITAGTALLQLGKIDEGSLLLEAAIVESRKFKNTLHEADARSKLAVARFYKGDTNQAATELESAIALQRASGEMAAEADGITRLAAVRVAQGKLDAAERILPAARKTLSDQHVLYDWAYASSVTAEIALARGRGDEAMAAIREIHARAPFIEKPALRIHVAVTEGRVLAALGRRNEALRMVGSALAEAERLELPLQSLGAMLVLGELQLGESSSKAGGVATIERARAKARALGLVYFDRKAGELLAAPASGTATSASPASRP
ncbi:MAG: protein kinase domain-containing protein [Thermoanaerobaculia bacterium]